MEITDKRSGRFYYDILQGILRNAEETATLASCATEGTDEALLFENVRKAISDFRLQHPAFRAVSKYRMDHFRIGNSSKGETVVFGGSLKVTGEIPGYTKKNNGAI